MSEVFASRLTCCNVKYCYVIRNISRQPSLDVRISSILLLNAVVEKNHEVCEADM